jgi:hypothetical protein
MVAIVEAEFRLFQVQQKGVTGHALELLKASFGEVPDGLDNNGVRGSADEFFLAVADAKTAVNVHVHQHVVAAPVVCVDHGRHVNLAPDNDLQGFFEQSGIISLYTCPSHLSKLKTMILPLAPRPRLPRSCRGPK